MKRILCPLFFLLATINLQAQNVGINTTTPGSTLSVNGSLSAGYKNVTTDYTLTAEDYFIVYSGSLAATFNLPPALPSGSGNFKGRVYRIKNNSNGLLTVKPVANEKISSEVAAIIYKGATLELISTGNTTGITWEAGAGLTADGIRSALEQGGCASCAAYDLAIVNTWVQITGAEYSKLQNTLPELGTYGLTGFNQATTSAFTGSVTMTQNFFSMYEMPARSYPVALGFKTGPTAPLTISGMQFKLSRFEFNGYYTYGSSLPTVTAPAAQTVYFFVIKRPTDQSGPNLPSNLAMYQSASNQIGRVVAPNNTSSYIYYRAGNENSFTTTLPAVSPIFFVRATPVRSW